MFHLFATATPQYHHWWFPDAASSYAGEIDNMFWMVLWLSILVIVLVFGLLAYYLVRYRYNPNRTANFTHGSRKLEIVWTVIPAIILIFLAVRSNALWTFIKDPARFPKNARVIQVHPRQFQWDISYAGRDSMFGTSDDIKSANDLYLALDEPVQIKLEGQDVIHSFFVPEFRIKQDAVPGLPTSLWVLPTRTGAFDLGCAEFCGLAHFAMRGTVYVMSKDSLDKWLNSQGAAKR